MYSPILFLPQEDFRTSLIHAFHCRTPSCPVAACASMSAKLERLHQHVSRCNEKGCVLCSMWTYLKYYRDSSEQASSCRPALETTGGLCQALYVEPLMQSSQLLPRWQNGKVSWVPPRDALEQLNTLTAGTDGISNSVGLGDSMHAPPACAPPPEPTLLSRAADVAPHVDGQPRKRAKRAAASRNPHISGTNVRGGSVSAMGAGGYGSGRITNGDLLACASCDPFAELASWPSCDGEGSPGISTRQLMPGLALQSVGKSISSSLNFEQVRVNP